MSGAARTQDLCEQLDAALLTIATLSSKLAEAERRARIEASAAASARFALANARARLAERAPSAEREPATVVAQVQVVAFPKPIVVDGVVELSALCLRQARRDGRIRQETIEYRITDVITDPPVDAQTADGFPGEHEPDALIEHVIQLQVRLVAHQELGVADGESAPVISHTAPSIDSGHEPTDPEASMQSGA